MRLYVPATLALLNQYRENATIPADVERVVADDETEDAEYLALMTAADLSAERGTRRRVVIVVDRPVEEGAIPWSEIAAVHADAVPFTDPDDEPGWYGVQEVANLIASL